MRLKEINKPIKEYRNVVTPRDEAHYREMMKTLHNLELKSASDPATMAEIKRRRMELRNWAEQNLKRESQPDVGAERADAARGMWASSKEIQSRFKTWQDFMNSEDFDEWLDDKFREDQSDVGNYAREIATGKIVRIVDYTDDDEGIYTISYGDGKGETDVLAKDLKFIDPTVHTDIDFEDTLQNKLEKAMQEYDSPEKKAQRDALMKQYLAKGGKVEKVPAGVKAYKGKELKPAYKKDNGTPITSPGSDESVGENDKDKPTDKEIRQAKGIAFDKRYKGGNYTGASNTIDKLKKGLSDHPDVADALRRANEGAPFDGKGILQRAVFNKWISAEEWFHLKDEWQDAARELEQRYSDWPDGEGFGSSDHNFAIRDLMSIVGYEFDDQDTSGKFVVTKMPEKLEKLGITNVRMRGEPVKAEADGLQPADLKRLGQTEPMIYVHKDGKTILIPKRKHNEYIAKGWKLSSLRAETSYESKLAEMLKQRLK